MHPDGISTTFTRVQTGVAKPFPGKPQRTDNQARFDSFRPSLAP
jgi:hypothetical protein